MPLNGGEMDKMAGQEGSRPRAAQIFQLAKKSRTHFSSQSKNLCKKNNHGSYLLRFSTMPQLETVLPRKTNQGAVQGSGFTYSRLAVCKTEKLALVLRLRQCCIYKCKNNSLVLLEIQEVFASASLQSCEHDSSTEMSSSNPKFSQRSGPLKWGAWSRGSALPAKSILIKLSNPVWRPPRWGRRPSYQSGTNVRRK